MVRISSTLQLRVAAAARGVDADLLIVPCFENDDLADLREVDAAAGGDPAAAFARGELRGRPFDLWFTRIGGDGWRPGRLVLVGAGPRSSVTPDRLRKVAAAGGLAARQRRFERVAFVWRGDAGPGGLRAVAEGLSLAAFDAAHHKTGPHDLSDLREAWIVVQHGGQGEAAEAVRRGGIFGASTNLARNLCNEPANLLTPRVLADRAVEIARGSGLVADVLDERRIAELKMGLVLGVAKGSAEPPRVIVLTHAPEGAPAAPVLGLIGKGITFDTGGISLKPAEGMERMKGDMAGGAAVICAMRAIAESGARLRVIGVVPATENMPGERATKPGDVLTSAGGRTVEVVNTDAEGRLVLGDALWLARQLGATHLLDVATLTGACIVALGRVTSGLFGRPDDWTARVREAGERAGERCWPLPLFDEYLEQLRSEVADVANSGGRPAGAITGAIFLREFAGDCPWAHLDIAGTAWSDEARPWQPKGATGIGVRTLAGLALDWGGEPGAD